MSNEEGEGATRKRLKVLIVDDDDFTRVTLTSTLRAFNCNIVGDAATAAAAIQAAQLEEPEIAVLDLDLGEGPTGIDLARTLRRDYPKIGIVMLSTYEEPRLMGNNLPPLPEGSVYLVKRSITNPEVLERALRLAANPESHTDATIFLTESNGSILAELSDQQVEVMRLIAAGFSNAEIARRREINEASVEKAVARLIKHFDLKATKEQNQRVMIAQVYFRLTGAVRARQR
ncbi:MAG: response regulator transcription factor [Thermoleophilia bacterium]